MLSCAAAAAACSFRHLVPCARQSNIESVAAVFGTEPTGRQHRHPWCPGYPTASSVDAGLHHCQTQHHTGDWKEQSCWLLIAASRISALDSRSRSALPRHSQLPCKAFSDLRYAQLCHMPSVHICMSLRNLIGKVGRRTCLSMIAVVL